MIENFKISVIGSGTMGNGIAHVFAQSGFKTLLIDIDKNQLNKALSTIRLNLDRQFISEPFVYHLWHERTSLTDFTKLYKNRDLYNNILNNTTNYTANNNTFFGKKNK